MPKSKKNRDDKSPERSTAPSEEFPEEEEDVDEWMSKYIGENQITWFVRIIRTHASKAIRDKIPELEKTFNEKLAKVQQKASEDVEELRSENKKLNRALERLQFQLHKKDAKINELMVKIDSIEQKEFCNDVQVVGVEESESTEDDTKKILKLAKEKMGIKLKKADIECTTRLGRKPVDKVTCRDIVVRFKDQSVREVFYGNRKKLATSKIPHMNIYVNDRLTNHRKAVFFQARKLYKSRKLFSTWTQKGNVLVRLKEDGPITQIENFEDLRSLTESVLSLRSQNSPLQDSSPSSSYAADIASHLSDYSYYVEP